MVLMVPCTRVNTRSGEDAFATTERLASPGAAGHTVGLVTLTMCSTWTILLTYSGFAYLIVALFVVI